MDCFVGSVEEFDKRTPKLEEKPKKRELRKRGAEESGKERTVVECSLLRLKTLHRIFGIMTHGVPIYLWLSDPEVRVVDVTVFSTPATLSPPRDVAQLVLMRRR